MKQLLISLAAVVVSGSLVIVGCAPAAPAPTPTKAPAAPTKAAEPTKPAAATAAPTKPAEPTKPAAQPTAVPATKVDFPQKGKSINLIIPWAAGGGTDSATRLMLPAMEQTLGVPLQVVNKAGAGSQAGMAELAAARPDGYTFGTNNEPTTIALYLDPERKATFTGKSFVSVANQVWDTDAIGVKADSPIKSVKDLVDAAKAKPEGIKIGHSGYMTENQLALLLLEQAAGVKFAEVAFDGGAPATNALLGGHVDAIILSAANFMSQFKAGTVRLLGVMDRQEIKFFPGVKTFDAQGYKVYWVVSRGFVAPAGTPKEIVDILSGAVKKAMETDTVKTRMDELGFLQRYMGPAEYDTMRNEMEAQTRPLVELARKQKK